MLNRWLGILFAFAMLMANFAVFQRDILPNWLAGDPPPNDAQKLGEGDERKVQVGIYDEDNRLLGRSWTRAERKATGGLVTVRHTTALRPIHLPGGVTSPPVLVEINITYRSGRTTIDELEFRMSGLPLPVWMKFEAVETGEFPCKWQVGEEKGEFLLDSSVPPSLGDVIRPFDRLPNLHVGQSWQLKLINPLEQLLPNFDPRGAELEPVIVRVTGRETMEHNGARVQAFVVETEGAKAWVADDGRVLRQTVRVPLLGELTLLDETYDPRTYERATRAAPEWRSPEPTDNP
jgi:hypothetical protein